MKKIKIKLRILVFLNLMTLLFVFQMIANKMKKGDQGYMYSVLLVVGFLLLLLSFFLFCKQYCYYRQATLIIENQILLIPLAVFQNSKQSDINLCLSCFGILMEDRVIPFDSNTSNLQELKIDGKETIITYRRNGLTETLKILGSAVSPNQVNLFRQRLYYETGIKAEINLEHR